MKFSKTALSMAVLTLLAPVVLQAQIAYEVRTVQTVVAGPKLQVDFQIRSTGVTTFVLGTSTFVVNYNTLGLASSGTNVARVTANDGPWSGAQNADYNALAVSKGTGYAGVTVVFVGGTTETGLVVPGTFTRIGSITIVITDPTKTSQLAWRAIASVTQVLKVTSPGVATGGACDDITNAPSFLSLADAPLPVEMTNCVAVANRLNTTINWTTATETNNFGFDVERKMVTGSDWVKVGFVTGKGTSATPTHYSYVDESVAPGTYNYRIKQIDKSGASSYSSEMSVEVGSAARVFSLADNYPNPFNPTTNIEFTLPSNGHVSLKVYNSIGQEVATLFDGEGQAGRYIQAKFDATRLASGIYFARLQYGGKSLMKKMLLVK
jgi:hypothetical protein